MLTVFFADGFYFDDRSDREELQQLLSVWDADNNLIGIGGRQYCDRAEKYITFTDAKVNMRIVFLRLPYHAVGVSYTLKKLEPGRSGESLQFFCAICMCFYRRYLCQAQSGDVYLCRPFPVWTCVNQFP